MIDLNGETYEESIVKCPNCSEGVRALIVLDKRRCPKCFEDKSSFFDDAMSSDGSDGTERTTETDADCVDDERQSNDGDFQIKYPFDGKARTVSKQ